MQAILHVSDLHIGQDDQTTEAAAEVMRAIPARFGTSDKPLVIITGDLTHDGEPEQYAVAKDLVDGVRGHGFEVICLPGNHDYGPAGSHAQARRFTSFKEAFYPLRHVAYPDVFVMENWAVLALDSMKAETGFFDGLLADGELGSKQIRDLATFLKRLQPMRASGMKVVVALHHHPFMYPDQGLVRAAAEWATHWLKDGAKLMKELRDQTDVLLFGHEHYHIDLSQPIEEVNLAEQYGIPLILSCGSTSGAKVPFGTSTARQAWLITCSDGKLNRAETISF